MSDVIPDFASTCPPGTRVVCVYVLAKEDGTWGERRLPWYGTVTGVPVSQMTVQGPWWTVEIMWDGEPVPRQTALATWWRQGIGCPVAGDSETGMSRAEDEDAMTRVVRAKILCTICERERRLRADAAKEFDRWVLLGNSAHVKATRG